MQEKGGQRPGLKAPYTDLPTYIYTRTDTASAVCLVLQEHDKLEGAFFCSSVKVAQFGLLTQVS